MKFTIVTIGSRGDIQPFLALGVGLSQAGHQVKLATHHTFASWIESYGLEFAQLEGNPQEWLESEAGKQIMESAKNPLQFIRLFGEAINSMMDSLMSDAWAACQGADAIFSHFIVAWVQDLARRLNVPYFMTAFSPVSATSEYPISLTPGKSLGGLLNYLSYPVSQLMFWQLFRSPTNKWLKSNIDSVPHNWLFPQCAAVVHHGGAGTTAAGLRAGIPTIIVPFLGDQPFWGNRLASLGVGTEPISQQDLTEDKLAQAIASVIENKAIVKRAKDLGKQIESEDGVGNSVKAIEEHLNSGDWAKSSPPIGDRSLSASRI